MAVKNTAQVVIDGKIITLGGYESEEYFQKVAAYMNNKISELSQMPGYSRQAMETKHTLLSLNITDDYFKAKKQAEIFEQDLQQKDQEMYDLKHELISLKMQIEEAKKAEQEAQDQKNLLDGNVKELEKELGFELFLRTSRGIVVTPDGEEFLGYARQVTEQYRLLRNRYIEKESREKFSVSMQHYSFAVKAFVETVKRAGMENYEFAVYETEFQK